MVVGLDRFKTHFAAYPNEYVLIGGAACTVAMDAVGLQFRATKDLDIVLCAEALTPSFGRAFWEFVTDGKYERNETSTGKRQFYRFQKPTDESFPFMLELFSRAPDVLVPAEGSHLTPIPLEEEVSSLSAILMDDNYYSFLQNGKRIVDGVQIAGAEQLIPLKARAWLDLKERISNGANVDSREVKKHKNDVFRLSAIVDGSLVGTVPEKVKADLASFLEMATQEVIDLRAMGLGSQTIESVTTELRSIYRL